MGRQGAALREEGLGPVMAALQAELCGEATAAAASRLLVESLAIGRVSLLLDLHVFEGSQHIPVTIDTHRRDCGPSEHVWERHMPVAQHPPKQTGSRPQS